LIERYVEDGTLRFEWRDFAYLGQESRTAAQAARAAQEQGKFWKYHDALYQNQDSINGGTFSDEKLIELAGEVGLDTKSFESDLTSGRFEPVVQRDLREAQDTGIQGTPSFTVNGQRLVGPQPLEAFEQAIEEELQKAGGDPKGA
jgi:protein-disulfide isomerase